MFAATTITDLSRLARTELDGALAALPTDRRKAEEHAAYARGALKLLMHENTEVVTRARVEFAIHGHALVSEDNEPLEIFKEKLEHLREVAASVGGPGEVAA